MRFRLIFLGAASAAVAMPFSGVVAGAGAMAASGASGASAIAAGSETVAGAGAGAGTGLGTMTGAGADADIFGEFIDGRDRNLLKIRRREGIDVFFAFFYLVFSALMKEKDKILNK
jgi:hypothetical protein